MRDRMMQTVDGLYGKPVGASDGCGTVVVTDRAGDRRALASISSIEVEWHAKRITSEEAMARIADVLRIASGGR